MTNNNSKGVMLVSLNSRRLDNFIENGLKSLDSIEEELDVYVFDTFEVLNGIVFNSKHIQEAESIIHERIRSVYDQLFYAIQNQGDVLRYSEQKGDLKKYMNIVVNELFSNSSFERHVQNQIFQNLQPKLRSVGITDKKSYLIEILSPFLLAEIAYYLYVFDTSTYDNIYGLESEMEIIQAIKKGKYENFNTLINSKVNYSKIHF